MQLGSHEEDQEDSGSSSPMEELRDQSQGTQERGGSDKMEKEGERRRRKLQVSSSPVATEVSTATKINALIWRDFQIARTQKRMTWAEFIVPLIITTFSVLVLSNSTRILDLSFIMNERKDAVANPYFPCGSFSGSFYNIELPLSSSFEVLLSRWSNLTVQQQNDLSNIFGDGDYRCWWTNQTVVASTGASDEDMCSTNPYNGQLDGLRAPLLSWLEKEYLKEKQSSSSAVDSNSTALSTTTTSGVLDSTSSSFDAHSTTITGVDYQTTSSVALSFSSSSSSVSALYSFASSHPEDVFRLGPYLQSLSLKNMSTYHLTTSSPADLAREGESQAWKREPLTPKMFATKTYYNLGGGTINIRLLFTLFACFGFASAYAPIVAVSSAKLIVEKQNGVREHMRKMGVSLRTYTLASLISISIRLFLITLYLFVTFIGFKLNADPLKLFQAWLLFLPYGIALTALSLLTPTWFRRPNFGAAFIVVTIMVGALAAMTVSVVRHVIPQLVVALIFPSAALLYGIVPILSGTTSVTLALPYWACLLCLCVQVPLYSVLSIVFYVLSTDISDENSDDGRHSKLRVLQRVFCACFSRGGRKKSARKCGSCRVRVGGRDSQADADEAEIPLHKIMTNQEEENIPKEAFIDSSLRENAITIRGLKKFYSIKSSSSPATEVEVSAHQSIKRAVDDLDLTVKRGELFALLGHNGAGKSTTIDILTGEQQPSTVDSLNVLGFDGVEEMDAIRDYIAVCGQKEALNMLLNPRQHLELFARLKGTSIDRVDRILNGLSLAQYKGPCHTLSGGTKRRVSVGIALVCNCPLIILDEPTSGLDPMSRRELWDLLKEELKENEIREGEEEQQQRDSNGSMKKKTILLTTHYMDEADYLADRIGIMAAGKLVCCDTPSALKKQFNIGPRLSLVTSTETTTSSIAAVKTATSTSGGSIRSPTDVDIKSTVELKRVEDCLSVESSHHQQPKEVVPEAPFLPPLPLESQQTERSFSLPTLHPKVSNLIQKYFPSSVLESTKKNSVVIRLLTSTKSSSTTEGATNELEEARLLGELLLGLENLQTSAGKMNDGSHPIGIEHFSVEHASLEDVFLKTLEEQHQDPGQPKNTISSSSPPSSSVPLVGGKEAALLFDQAAEISINSFSLFWAQLRAIWLKKLLFTRRSSAMFVFGVLVPTLLIVTGYSVVIPNNLISGDKEGNGKVSVYPVGFVPPALEDQWTSEKERKSLKFEKLFGDGRVAPLQIPIVGHEDRGAVDSADLDLSIHHFTRLFPIMYQQAQLFPSSSSSCDVQSDQWVPSLEILRVSTVADFWSGAYIPKTSVFYFERSSFPLRIEVQELNFSSITNRSRAWAADFTILEGNATYTYWTKFEYNSSFLLLMDHVWRSALIAAREEKTKVVESSSSSWLPPTSLTFSPLVNVLPLQNLTGAEGVDDSAEADSLRRFNADQIPRDGKSSVEYYYLLPIGITTVVATGHYIANAVLAVADEHNRGVYTAMKVHGLRPLPYWVGTFTFDWIFGQLITFIAFIVPFTVRRDITQLSGSPTFMSLVACMISLYIAFMLLLGYAACVFIRNLEPLQYLGLIRGFNFMLWFIPTLIVGIIALVDGGDEGSVAHVRGAFNSLTPPRALINLISTAFTHVEMQENDVWATPQARDALLSILWSIVPLLLICFHAKYGHPSALYQEYRLKQQMKKQKDGGETELEEEEDFSSTVASPTVVPSSSTHAWDEHGDPTAMTSSILGSHLVKKFIVKDPSGKTKKETIKTAVNGVSLGLEEGECFGLLGPNGSGKTTTTQMLVGELLPTSGAVTYNNNKTSSDHTASPSKATCSSSREARLGLCDQGDTLWDNLTGEEHLDFYLRLRLGPLYSNPAEWAAYRKFCLAQVGLANLKDSSKDRNLFFTRVGGYSGGMKRKLAVTIAVQTGAKRILLDEPSTGVDPQSRRAMWELLHESLVERRSTILLVTHHTDEAEAVCNRIGIMMKGKVRAVGPAAVLKSRYGNGLTITFHTSSGHSTGSLTTAEDEQSVKQDSAPTTTNAIASPPLSSERLQEIIDSADLNNGTQVSGGRFRVTFLESPTSTTHRYSLTAEAPSEQTFKHREGEEKIDQIASRDSSLSTSLSLGRLYLLLQQKAASLGGVTAFSIDPAGSLDDVLLRMGDEIGKKGTKSEKERDRFEI